jgi:hypothetical protein
MTEKMSDIGSKIYDPLLFIFGSVPPVCPKCGGQLKFEGCPSITFEFVIARYSCRNGDCDWELKETYGKVGIKI